jgi:hypothetical protein
MRHRVENVSDAAGFFGFGNLLEAKMGLVVIVH